MNRVRKQVGAEEDSVMRYTGRGIGVAVLDSGVCRHPDLYSRIRRFYNFLSDKRKAEQIVDDYGHGTHVSCLFLVKVNIL